VSTGDRVAVPTNGHRPALTDDALDAPHHDGSGSPDQPGQKAEASDAAPASDPAASSASLPTMTSGQVIAGFGLLAALALLLLGRRRGRD
jgi:hypothetical protein